MEGSREIEDTIPSHSCSSYNHSLKLWKVNIGSAVNPKIYSIGYYWDEQTINEVQTTCFQKRSQNWKVQKEPWEK
jgi:hypothetical protein